MGTATATRGDQFPQQVIIAPVHLSNEFPSRRDLLRTHSTSATTATRSTSQYRPHISSRCLHYNTLSGSLLPPKPEQDLVMGIEQPTKYNILPCRNGQLLAAPSTGINLPGEPCKQTRILSESIGRILRSTCSYRDL